MAVTETQHQQGLKRLAEHMADRRRELGKRWEDIAAEGGPSIKTLRDIRNGHAGIPTERTLDKIDVALRWEHLSADRIYRTENGTPTPMPDSGRKATVGERADDDVLIEDALVIQLSRLTDEQRARIFRRVPSPPPPPVSEESRTG